MALSNINKDTLERLFEMVNIRNKETKDYNALTNIRSNYATYSKLEMIAKQMDFLKNEALNILSNHDLNDNLKEVKCNFRKVPGTYYYVYLNEQNQKLLSLVSPNEWCNSYKFIEKVYYDYDFIKRGAKHRIKNIGTSTALMIEVQFGEKIDENDIKRYDDKYGRS